MNQSNKQLIKTSFEILPLKILKETSGNPQSMTEREFSGLVISMKKKGWILDAPVIWKKTDNEYQIISGHHRVRAGIEAGIIETGCKVIEGITEEQARLFVLEANQRRGEFNDSALNDFIDNLKSEFDLDVDYICQDAGFDIDELFPKQIETVDDDTVPDESNIGVETGDIWELGKHRVLCGDASDTNNFNTLLKSEKPCIVITDPPYGVAIGDKNKMLNSFQKARRNLKNIESDSLKPDDLKNVLSPIFKNIKNFASEDCTFFVTAPQGGELGMMMMMMMKEALYETRHVLIWKKNSPTFSMGRLDYDYQHEPILLTWGKKHKSIMRGKFRTSVWEIDKPRANKEHPTMKPVELYENALLNNSEVGDFALDAFGGSGTMIIACERTGRIGCVIEIDPHYVSVIIIRWINWMLANNREKDIVIKRNNEYIEYKTLLNNAEIQNNER